MASVFPVGADRQSNLMSVTEAAIFLRKSERTIRRYIAAGKLPTIAIGPAIFVQMAGIDPGHVLARPLTADNTPADMADHGRANAAGEMSESAALFVQHLQEENRWLRAQLEARLPLPAPAPDAQPTQAVDQGSKRGGSWRYWLLFGAVAALTAAAWYWALWGAAPHVIRAL